jgi:hypothetical protein
MTKRGDGINVYYVDYDNVINRVIDFSLPHPQIRICYTH